jgi:hypothetical protein
MAVLDRRLKSVHPCSPEVYISLGNTSRFNTSLSIDILPGPVNNRLILIAINSELVNIAACLNSVPHTKP